MAGAKRGESVISEPLADLVYPSFLAALDAQNVALKRFVYALCDPREVEVTRYVGCSFRVGTRYREHILDARRPSWYSNGRKVLFIQQLLCDGVFPAMLLLEEVPTDEGWAVREELWIRARRSEMLTNFERPPVPEGPPPHLPRTSGRWW